MKTMNRDQIFALLNGALNDVMDDIGVSQNSFGDLVVNVALSRFDEPGMTVGEAILASCESEADEGEEESDQQIIDRVLGWAEQAIDS